MTRSRCATLPFMILLAVLTVPYMAMGQEPTAIALSNEVQAFLRFRGPSVAIVHAMIIDGTGTAPLENQTILIAGKYIRAMGPSAEVTVPADAEVIDATGHTVIPGIVGMHNHTFYITARGTDQESRVQLGMTSPRLYIASGVTTVRTTGSSSPYEELALRAAINRGDVVGPRMHITGPYFNGPSGGLSDMHVPDSPNSARRAVRYWAEEGATWVKGYARLRRAELAAMIDEAHTLGLKVTGHLCAVSHEEAVELGIDSLEHTFFSNSGFDPTKEPDVCPPTMFAALADLNLDGELARNTIGLLVKRHVAMTSAAYEFFAPERPPIEQRVLDVLAPVSRDAYLESWERYNAEVNPLSDSGATYIDLFRKAMRYERLFVDAGGILGAGSDPCCPTIPGFGDQRNFELLREAGFSAPEVVEIMSANGAKILGEYERLGSIEAGKLADLVLINGNLARDPEVIRNVIFVFKDGLGYDSNKLIDSVRGLVGLR